jgi:amino-acid N-acetyltransferase
MEFILRRAKIIDVPEIVKLINSYAAKGEMLARAHAQIYDALRDFVVIEENDKIVGCGALHVVWSDFGEIRSLAIAEDRKNAGLGRRIVEFLIEDGKALEIPTIFTLTYKSGFFEKLGFTPIDKKDLPHKVWKDCINCPKFPDCDEMAFVISLSK